MRRLRFPILFLLLASLGAHSGAQSSPPSESGAGAEETLSTFRPSEKVPADVAVAFPVDI